SRRRSCLCRRSRLDAAQLSPAVADGRILATALGLCAPSPLVVTGREPGAHAPTRARQQPDEPESLAPQRKRCLWLCIDNRDLRVGDFTLRRSAAEWPSSKGIEIGPRKAL